MEQKITPTAPAEVLAAWEALQPRWLEASQHDVFREVARQHRALPAAARLYRQRQLAQPQDEMAAAQLERITKLVLVEMSTVVAARLPASKPPYQKVVLLLSVLIAMVLAGLLYQSLTARAPASPAGGVGIPVGASLQEAEILRQRAESQRLRLERQRQRQRQLQQAPRPTPPTSTPKSPSAGTP